MSAQTFVYVRFDRLVDDAVDRLIIEFGDLPESVTPNEGETESIGGPE